MRFIKYSLLIFMLIISAITLGAQDDETSGDCEINLTSAGALIVQAQAEASSGQREAALRTIDLIRSVLDDAVERCGGDAVATDDVDLPAEISLGGLFNASNNTFSFAYPSDWVTQRVETFDIGGVVYLGSDNASLQAVTQSDPVLTSGQQSMAVIIGGPTENVFRFSDDATLEDAINSFAEDLADDPGGPTIGEITNLSINDFPAATFDFETEGFGGIILIIDRSDIGVFALILAATAPEEVEAIRPLTLAIAESITFND